MRLTRSATGRPCGGGRRAWLAWPAARDPLHRPVEGTCPTTRWRPSRAEDREVTAGRLLQQLPVQLPKVAPPRTPDNPEARRDLAADPARRRSRSAWTTPRSSASSRWVPRASRSAASSRRPLNTRAGAALGAGTLATVYDPAIQETQIAQALSVFDANFTTQFFYGNTRLPGEQLASRPASSTPAATRSSPGPRRGRRSGTPSFPATLQKRAATGATLPIANQVTTSTATRRSRPSRRPTRRRRTSSSPSRCSAAPAQNGPSGLEANRARS